MSAKALNRITLCSLLVLTAWVIPSWADDETQHFAPAPLQLESEQQAIAFAQSLMQQWGDAGGSSKVVEVLHLEGMRLSPYLETALIVLKQAGYQVRGTFVTRSALEEAVVNDPGAAVHYSANSNVDRRGLLSRVFGLPQGLTFFSHFARRPRDPQISKVAWQTALLGAATAAVMRVVMPLWLNEPQPNYAELTTTTTLLGTWIYYFMHQRRQWSSLRNQGGSVVVNPHAAEGKQIQACPNSNLFFTQCVVQEHTLSALIAATLYSFGVFGNPTPTEWAMIAAKFSYASVLSAASYVPFEQVMAKQIGEIESLRQSDPAEAERKAGRLGIMTKFFYNVLFPLASNTGRFFSGVWSSVPLAALGGGSWLWKRTQIPTATLGSQGLKSGEGCAALIRVLSPDA